VLERWVYPDGGWFGGWCGRFVDEAFGIIFERAIEDDLAGGVNVVRLTIVDLIGSSDGVDAPRRCCQVVEVRVRLDMNGCPVTG
jgi:hypothetical protein